MYYVGINLFLSILSLPVFLSHSAAWRYVLGVVVWILSQERMYINTKSRRFIGPLLFLITVFATLLITSLPHFSAVTLAANVLPKHKKSKKFSRRKKQRRLFTTTRMFAFKSSADTSSWRPRLWTKRYCKGGYFHRKLRKNFPGYRTRLFRLSPWRRLRALPTLSRRLRWVGRVLLLPWLHFHSGHFRRWPFVILVAVAALPLILHTFLWVIQDYDVTYYNLFTNYERANRDLFGTRHNPTSLPQQVKSFVATLFRMYLNGLGDFYFYEHWVCTVKFEWSSARLMLSSSWAYLFASLSVVAFFAGYGVQHWATWREIRKYMKKWPRIYFTKHYYPVLLIRLKHYLREYTRPVHPDKGRTDDWIYPVIILPHGLGYWDHFLNWLDSWIISFEWSQFVFVLFILSCLILQGATHVTKAITDKFLTATRIPLLGVLVNLLLFVVSVDLLHEVWSVWVATYGPAKGIWGFTVAVYKHTVWGGIAWVVSQLILLGGLIIYYMLRRRRIRQAAEYSCSLYLGRRIKRARSNRRAIKTFLNTFIDKRGGDCSHIYTPVLPEPRRVKPKPVLKNKNK